jgi:hypothetical protein
MTKQKRVTNLSLFAAILVKGFSGNAKAQDISTIKIGTQTWATKNFDVNTYRNGDTIPHVQYKTEWTKLKTGAWCYYDNKSENGTKYAKRDRLSAQ